MKCDRCNGTGRRVEESDNGIGWIPVKCEYCHGTGEVEQTEQEYIQTCNTEQLAEFLSRVFQARAFVKYVIFVSVVKLVLGANTETNHIESVGKSG